MDTSAHRDDGIGASRELTLGYWSIHSVAPDSLSFPQPHTKVVSGAPQQDASFSEFVYYSFVTMATLGYGDITPMNRVTRTLSWMQTVTGQFYVAVVIAWLVSALPQPGKGAT